MLWMLSASAATAQPPAISQNGVINAASRIPSGLTKGIIARGSRIAILGARLGGSSTRVRVSAGRGNREIPLESVTADRIEAVIPSDIPSGAGALVVETPGGASKPFPVSIAAASPGLFSVNGQGWGQGTFRTNGVSNSIWRPARPGQMVTASATGIAFARRVEILVGGRRAPSVFVKRAGAGIEDVLFEVPRNVPLGCFVPVYLRAAGVPPSNVVTIATSAPNTPCLLPGDVSVSATDHSFGVIAVSRVTGSYDRDRKPASLDEAGAAFIDSAQPDRDLSPLLVLPPAGTCTAYTGSAQSQAPDFTSMLGGIAGIVGHKGVDAGPELTISGANGSRTIRPSPGNLGAYGERLGLIDPASPRSIPLFLTGPEYTVTVPGGKIGAFRRALPVLGAFTWTNQDNLGEIDTSRGVTFEWRDAPADSRIVILASSVDRLSTATGASYCVASPEAGRFTISPEMLAWVPHTTEDSGRAPSFAALVAVRIASGMPPRVPGLDRLWLVSTYARGRTVIYR